MNEKAKQRIALEKEKRTGMLDLSLCELDEIPTDLAGMDWLVHLALIANKITTIENLDSLTNLQVLDLESNQISEIKNLDALQALKDLNLGANKISAIKNLEALHNLQSLELGNNQLLQISFQQTFTKLEQLSLSYNQINEIKNLDAVPFLKKLYLTGNQISEIKNLDAVPGLLSFSLRDNRISEIRNLEVVPNLEKLDLRKNQIKQIKNLEVLPHLKKLYLSYNQIETIENVEALTQLEKVRLEGNNIDKVHHLPALVRLASLQELRLFGIKNNNLHIPQEYFGKDQQDNCLPILRSYIEDIKHGGTYTKEVPVILVGNSTAGKTSLRFFLKDKVFPPPKDYSTHGIEPDIWQPDAAQWEDPIRYAHFKDAQIYFWDFGGQEYYHATHRIFFSRQAIYVLVWDKGTDKQGMEIIPVRMLQKNGTVQQEELPVELFPYRYWLNCIRLYAKQTEDAPILMVQNKMDVMGTMEEYPTRQNVQNLG